MLKISFLDPYDLRMPEFSNKVSFEIQGNNKNTRVGGGGGKGGKETERNGGKRGKKGG